jgi:hypothetical protein
MPKNNRGIKNLKNQYALNIILKAASYKSGLSRRLLEKTLGVSRRSTILRRVKISKEEMEEEIEDEDEDEEEEEEEEEKKGQEIESEEYINILEESTTSSYIDEGTVESDTSSRSSSTSGISEVSEDFLYNCSVSRKQRKDTVPLNFVTDFWHASCQFNTNSSQYVSVLNCDDPNNPFYEMHRVRLQTDSPGALYRTFENSQIYLDWLTSNPNKTVKYTLFKEAKCKCIKWDRLRKCADTTEVSFTEFFKAFSYIRRKIVSTSVNCDCLKCSNNYYKQEAHKTKSKFLEFLLCAQQHLDELARHKMSLLTKENLKLKNENILAHDSKRLKIKMASQSKNTFNEVEYRKIKKENSKPVESSYGFVQQEFLKIFKKECCHSNCEYCGVNLRLRSATCPLEYREDKGISYKKYVSQKFDDGSENTQLELRKVYVTQKQFFEDFYSFLEKNYLPHYYVAKWNNFHIKLAFDSIQSAPPIPNTINYDWLSIYEVEISKKSIWIQRDFSALYKCLGQDGGTCEQPRQAIQEVT